MYGSHTTAGNVTASKLDRFVAVNQIVNQIRISVSTDISHQISIQHKQQTDYSPLCMEFSGLHIYGAHTKRKISECLILQPDFEKEIKFHTIGKINKKLSKIQSNLPQFGLISSNFMSIHETGDYLRYSQYSSVTYLVKQQIFPARLEPAYSLL